VLDKNTRKWYPIATMAQTKKHIISLGGLPGSGKSTVRKILAEQLQMNSFSTGDFMRKMAFDRGITFDEFNALIATDKSIDEEIDAELIRIEAGEDNLIIDSHLAFHFVPSSFRVFLSIPLAVSAERIYKDSERESRKSVGDVMSSVEEAEARIQARIDNHNDRYMRFYGVSPYDPSQYDLVVDTEKMNPESVAAHILEEYLAWLAA
jgi:predicted cytidylate kinase